MGTKNNPDNRGASAKGKTFDGKEVKPVKFIGSQIGLGTYIAAAYDTGDMVIDTNGNPVPWDAI